MGAKGAVGDEKISSHSLKATLLAWAARRGVPENDRVVLGHHSLKSDSLATYSKDLLGAATRTLCGLIAEVKLGVFDPDGARSGLLLQQAGAAVGAGLDEEHAFWAEAADQEGAVVIDDGKYESGHERGEGEADDGFTPEELEHYAPVSDGGEGAFDNDFPGDERSETAAEEHEPEAEAVEAESSSSSSSSVSAESSGKECEEQFAQRQSNEAILHVSPVVPGSLVQNKRSKILHKISNARNDLAMCGSKVTAGFVKLPNGATFAWPRCARCFRGEVLGSKKDLVNFLDKRAKGSA